MNTSFQMMLWSIYICCSYNVFHLWNLSTTTYQELLILWWCKVWYMLPIPCLHRAHGFSPDGRGKWKCNITFLIWSMTPFYVDYPHSRFDAFCDYSFYGFHLDSTLIVVVLSNMNNLFPFCESSSYYWAEVRDKLWPNVDLRN